MRELLKLSTPVIVSNIITLSADIISLACVG